MVYIFLAEGFEEIEAIAVTDIIRRAGIDIKTVSIGKRTVTGAHGISINSDLIMDEVKAHDCSMIILPGGMPGTKNLQNDKKLSELIDEFHIAGKYIAAICAAPMILGAKGFLDGERATIFPGMETHLGNAFVSEESAIVSGKIITGRGPGCAIDFALKIIEVLKDKESADAVKSALVYPK